LDHCLLPRQAKKVCCYLSFEKGEIGMRQPSGTLRRISRLAKKPSYLSLLMKNAGQMHARSWKNNRSGGWKKKEEVRI